MKKNNLNLYHMIDDIFFRHKIFHNKIDYTEISEIELIDFYKENKIFQEQLMVANFYLYTVLEKYLINFDLPPKKYNSMINSLYNYYLRAHLRNTPFGTFSGVGKINKNNYKEKKYSKKIECSYNWLLKVIKKIESEYEMMLDYTFNNMIDDFLNDYLLIESVESDKNTLSIEKNEVLKLLEKKVYDSSYSKIINILSLQYPEEKIDDLHEYLHKLIQKEIIFSNLRPSLSTPNKLLWIINKLKNLNIEELDLIILSLEKIQSKFNKYSLTNLGEGMEIYTDIYNRMNDICSLSKDDIIVNLISNDEQPDISLSDKKNISDMVNSLSIVSCKDSRRENYINLFIEKFGTDAIVPIGTVLNKNMGIGFPDYDTENYQLSSQNILQSQLMMHISKSILQNQSSIDISKVLMNGLENPHKSGEYLRNFDICLEEFRDIENGLSNFYLSNIVGSDKLGKIMGRFTLYNSLFTNNKELSYSKDKIFCNINVPPKNSSLVNVIENKFTNEFSLSVSANSSIKKIMFSDIFVGYDNNNLYFTNKDNSVRFIFDNINMINRDLYNETIRFLEEFSNNSQYSWFNFPWLSLFNNLSINPEIRFKNIIISPLTIKVQKNLIDLKDENSFKNSFIKFIQSFQNLPNITYIFGDNKIPIIFSDLGMKNLFKLIKKNKEDIITLEKVYTEHLDSNKYLDRELIVSFEQMNVPIETSPIPYVKKSIWSPENNNVRYLGIDSSWVYFNILINDGNEKSFIKNHFETIQNDLSGDNPTCFYIFYEENSIPTVRLRIKKNNFHESIEIFFKIHCLLLRLQKLGKIYSFSLQPYIREIERYGGINGISICESIFSVDSTISTYILKHTTYNNQKIFCAISILEYLKIFLIKPKIILNFFEEYIDLNKKHFLTESNLYRKESKLIDDYITEQSLIEIQDFLNIINKRNKFIDILVSSVNINNDLINSLLHMTCNRILGTDRKEERGALYLAYKIFISEIKRYNIN